MEKIKFFEDMIVRNISKEMKRKMREIKIKKGISFSQQVRNGLSLFFKILEENK